MAEIDQQFIARIVDNLGQMALIHATPAVQRASSQLGRALRVYRTEKQSKVRVGVPHYWAVYVHDGRGPFGPREATFLVWFRDPADDPRLRNGEQVERARDIKRLTAEQFYTYLEINRNYQSQGLPGPMIIARFQPKSTPGKYFFDNDKGMQGFPEKAGEYVSKEFSKHVKESLGEYLNVRLTTKMSL